MLILLHLVSEVPNRVGRVKPGGILVTIPHVSVIDTGVEKQLAVTAC